MMKRDIMIFSLGGIIGALVTFLFMDTKHQKFLEDEANWCEDLANLATPDIEPPEDYIKTDGRLMKKEEPTEMGVDYATGPDETKKVLVMNKDHYKKVARVYNVVKEYPVVTTVEPDNDGVPYVITFEEFNDTCEKYDKITLNYYSDDDSLADEQEELIDDVVSLVGPDSLNQFGNNSEDPDVVYVRNNKLETDYEIIRNHGSYAELVCGIIKET